MFRCSFHLVQKCLISGKLRKLDLSYNAFVNVPDCVTLQLNLRDLDMTANQVVHMGQEFITLRQLETLNLSMVSVGYIERSIRTRDKFERDLCRSCLMASSDKNNPS